MKFRNKVNFYDLEIFPNLFMVDCWNNITNKHHVFGHNKLKEFIKYYKDIGGDEVLWIGHNVIRYDNVMIRAWLNEESINGLYKLSKSIIESPTYKHNYKLENRPFKNCCDTICLAPTALKSAGIIMNTKSIVECTIPWDDFVIKEDVPDIVKYCQHDVELTKDLYGALEGDLKVRDKVKELGICANPYRMTFQSIFENYIRDNCYCDTWNTQYFDSIPMHSIFTDSKGHDLIPNFIDSGCRDLIGRLSQAEFNQETGKIIAKKHNTLLKYNDKNELVESRAKGWNVVFQSGHVANFGIGGGHSVAPTKIYNDPTKVIIHVDVSSYYPSLMKTFKFYPNHVDGFDGLFVGMLNKRLKAKTECDIDTATAYKLMLNSLFGKMRSEGNGGMKDMVNGSKITAVGQLWLFKIVDLIQIYFENKHFEIIQINTDGVFVEIELDELDSMHKVKNTWEGLISEDNSIKLDLDIYKAFYQADVNNYFATTFDDKVKSVGRFADKTIVKKLIDAPIIFKTVKDYLINGIDPAETVKTASYESCIFQKSAKNGYIVDGIKVNYKHLRFVASLDGAEIKYVDKGGEKNLGSSKYKDLKCGIVYDLSSDRYTINQDFYVNQAYYWIYKMVSGIKKMKKPTVEYIEMLKNY